MIIQGKVWGITTPLFNKNNVELHIIKIKKGGFCSKHLHKHKYNRFIVLEGQLKISIWKDYGTETLEDVSILDHSQECTVSPGDFHKFEALEDTTALEIYWVELSTNDIARLDHGGIKNGASDMDILDRAESINCGRPAYAVEYGNLNALGTLRESQYSSDK